MKPSMCQNGQCPDLGNGNSGQCPDPGNGSRIEEGRNRR